MGRPKDLSPSKVGFVKGLLSEGNLSIRQIAEKSGISKSSVQNISQKLQSGDSLSVHRVGKCGRKSLLTERGKRVLSKIVKDNRRASNGEIRQKLEDAGVKLSTRTVRRRLGDLGFKSRRPKKKPRLTEAMMKKRLDWAKKHQHYTVDDWKRVCFSDESSIEILKNNCQYVKRMKHEAYNAECLVQTVKHPGSVMIWSVISSKGLGRIHIVEGTMRQQQYISVLETRLLPQIQEWFESTEQITFQQDNAPCHTAKTVKKFMQDKKINLLDWPGNSPDLNPIENVWELLKMEISKENVTNKTMLIEKIIYHWHHNERLKNMAINCIKSMARRVEAVIKNKGGVTKY